MANDVSATPALLERVRNLLQQPDAVLFIGSGVSLWSGLPTWLGLLNELATFREEEGLSAETVRKEIKANDLLFAASYGISDLAGTQLIRFIKRCCKVAVAKPHDIHKKIVSLGPRCYITTNYDQLIEESLRIWRKDIRFRMVTNNQVAECADIMQARAIDYVFKPHGDINDVQSIILTREQYRHILQGTRHYVLETLKTLLVSRPVLYIGFGLRDPDYQFLKESIAETFKGGARDHYAIISDVSEDEIRFWRTQYGIHLVPYQTKLATDGRRDHSPLLDLLDSLGPQDTQSVNIRPDHRDPLPTPKSDPKPLDLSAPETVLALARYAATAARLAPPQLDTELPLCVSARELDWNQGKVSLVALRHHEQSVGEFLESHARSAILLGSPGAGKSYAVRKWHSTLGERLRATCIDEPAAINTTIIPVYIDLKLYRGNLVAMAEEVLPPTIRLTELCRLGSVQVYLDSVNELPREYIERGDFEKDLSLFLEATGPSRVLFTSRTDEGLQQLDLPTFHLMDIEHKFVTDYLESSNYCASGTYARETIGLLRKPLFFRLLQQGILTIDMAASPKVIFQQYFSTLARKLCASLPQLIDIEHILSGVAIKAIDGGEEFVLSTDLEHHVRHKLTDMKIHDTTAKEVVNALISENVLIPASGSRLTFFHQTFTEYLAALQLAVLYRATPDVLNERLRNTRWDQAILLTLGFLNSTDGQGFLDRILAQDTSLAIRAAKYQTFDQDRVLRIILSRVLHLCESITQQYGIRGLNELPFGISHWTLLEKLMKSGGILGGVAAGHLLRLNSVEALPAIVDIAFSRISDYNFGSAVGREIAPFVTDRQLHDLFNRLGTITQLPPGRGPAELGPTQAVARALSSRPIAQIERLMRRLDDLSECQLAAISDVLFHDQTKTGFKLIQRFVRAGKTEGFFPLHMRLEHREKGAEYSGLVTDGTIRVMLSNIAGIKPNQWCLLALRWLCMHRLDVANRVFQESNGVSDFNRLVFRIATSHFYPLPFWSEVAAFAANGALPDDYKLIHDTFYCCQKIDWTGHEAILEQLLRRRCAPLALGLLEYGSEMKGDFGLLCQDLSWWLIWLDERHQTQEVSDWFFCDRIGHFLSEILNSERRAQCIALFNDPGCSWKAVMAEHLLSRFSNVTLEMLSTTAIDFLINQLHDRHYSVLSPNRLLVVIATEPFVRQRLLPLLTHKEEPLRSNLRQVLKSIGHNHRCRYLTAEDEI